MAIVLVWISNIWIIIILMSEVSPNNSIIDLLYERRQSSTAKIATFAADEDAYAAVGKIRVTDHQNPIDCFAMILQGKPTEWRYKILLQLVVK